MIMAVIASYITAAYMDNDKNGMGIYVWRNSACSNGYNVSRETEKKQRKNKGMR